MNLQNIEEVKVNIKVKNGDGSKVTFVEKVYKITDKHVLSIYEEGISNGEFTYDNNVEILLGTTILDLQWDLNESLNHITQIGKITVIY